jgi:hypothetical protein
MAVAIKRKMTQPVILISLIWFYLYYIIISFI